MDNIVYISIGISILSFLFAIITYLKLVKINNKYKRFMKGLGEQNIENLMNEYLKELNDIKNYSKHELTNKIEDLNRRMQYCVQSVGLVRYNAFENMGNEMSFSLAAIDERKNGYIITGIYSRDHSFVYAKEIKKGSSSHDLSEEETEALNKAQNKYDKWK